MEPYIISGKYADAKVFADILEDSAKEQIQQMCDQPFTEGCSVRIMPDVHTGKGCTIGTTMTVRGRAVPNVVGADIGCGMYAVHLAEKDISLPAMDAAAHRIPSGLHVWDRIMEPFDFSGLRCLPELLNQERLACSLGTLGGGNHFIEVDRAGDGSCWLVIHSGSRNLGKQVAEHYQELAIRRRGAAGTLRQLREETIARLKAEGRHTEISGALAKIALEHPPVPDDLCWLEGEELAAYLHDVEICQRFALRSRELMAEILLRETGLTAVDAFHTVHNYIDTDEMILRKGAIAAHAGERVLIPINMRDGSVLATGRGNPDWNFSAPHGAGRLLSRGDARRKLTLEEYRKAMAGIYTTSVNEATLDEAPMAYKPLEDIIGIIGACVDIQEILHPIYNFKAAE